MPVPSIVGTVKVATTGSFVWPVEIEVGDLMLIALSAHWSATATVDDAPGAGFVEIGSVVTSDDGARDCRLWLYGKTADGSEAGTTETMGTTAGNDCSAGIVLRGAPSTSFVHTSGDVFEHDVRPTAPAVTSTVDNCLSVLFFVQSDDAPAVDDNWTGGAGADYTHRARAGSSGGDDRQIRIATAGMATAATISGKQPATVAGWSTGSVTRVLVIVGEPSAIPGDISAGGLAGASFGAVSSALGTMPAGASAAAAIDAAAVLAQETAELSAGSAAGGAFDRHVTVPSALAAGADAGAAISASAASRGEVIAVVDADDQAGALAGVDALIDETAVAEAVQEALAATAADLAEAAEALAAAEGQIATAAAITAAAEAVAALDYIPGIRVHLDAEAVAGEAWSRRVDELGALLAAAAAGEDVTVLSVELAGLAAEAAAGANFVRGSTEVIEVDAAAEASEQLAAQFGVVADLEEMAEAGGQVDAEIVVAVQHGELAASAEADAEVYATALLHEHALMTAGAVAGSAFTARQALLADVAAQALAAAVMRFPPAIRGLVLSIGVGSRLTGTLALRPARTAAAAVKPALDEAS